MSYKTKSVVQRHYTMIKTSPSPAEVIKCFAEVAGDKVKIDIGGIVYNLTKDDLRPDCTSLNQALNEKVSEILYKELHLLHVKEESCKG